MVQTITKRKPKSRQNSHRVAAIVICLVLLVVVGAGAIIFLNRDRIFNTEKTSSNEQSTNSEEQIDEKHEEAKAEKKAEEKREAEKGSVNQYEGENPNSLETITGVVSFAGSEGASVSVRIMLDQMLGSSGSCNFTLTHTSGAKLSQTVTTEAGPSATFCIYSVPSSNVAAGHWQITTKVTASGKEGTINGEMDI
ncbi:hypothetical protein IJG78_00385 [Candidatus Saccharibacteria bacterium]|nr:hypothetical protein [Candidatus Saccharibacteria bacterium]